jgi:hypothetical protein
VPAQTALAPISGELVVLSTTFPDSCWAAAGERILIKSANVPKTREMARKGIWKYIFLIRLNLKRAGIGTGIAPCLGVQHRLDDKNTESVE